jgi:energy-coupling factor transport system substrate-specific component
MEQLQSKSRKRNIALTLTSVVLSAAVMMWVVFTNADRAYMYGSIAMMIIILTAFYAEFEKDRPQARTIVLVAVMITLAVAGRAAFFFLPQFKPIIAVVIIGGVGLGAQAGFVIGSMSAFVSNFIFGQGPWTAFQMVAWGLIGLFAGLLFYGRITYGNGRAEGNEKEPGRAQMSALLVYSAAACFLIHGGITDMWTAFSISDRPTLGTLITVYGSGLIADAVLAAATVIFLLIMARPMLKKIERVRKKYGM